MHLHKPDFAPIGDERELPITGDLRELQRWLADRGLTDGLPIIPPTEALVSEMLATVNEPPETSLGVMLPRSGDVTLEKLAINSVMAGAYPEYFPVIVAAVRAMMRPEVNIYGINATTHPAAPLIVVHGPIARELKISGGTGCFGPGYTANATIGRAIRLILMNVGGAYPGNGDQATQGSPAKFSYCIAENVAASPWPEFHTTRGFNPTDNAVTVFCGEAPHNIHDNCGDSSAPSRFLEFTADVMRQLGHNTWYQADANGRNESVVVFCPEHANLIAKPGWSRRDVQQFLFERARRSLKDLREFGGMWSQRDWPPWMVGMAELGDDVMLPHVRDAEGILVLVAGGPGLHSVFIPSIGVNVSATVPIQRR